MNKALSEYIHFLLGMNPRVMLRKAFKPGIRHDAFASAKEKKINLAANYVEFTHPKRRGRDWQEKRKFFSSPVVEKNRAKAKEARQARKVMRSRR